VSEPKISVGTKVDLIWKAVMVVTMWASAQVVTRYMESLDENNARQVESIELMRKMLYEHDTRITVLEDRDKYQTPYYAQPSK
jgi:hypothetical protein